MSTAVLYCPGCNEKFAMQLEDHRCPHCGQTLASSGDAPTLDLDQLEARETYGAAGQPSADARDELAGGRLGVYLIEKLLGKGGMGRVYLATHLMLERPCAVKVLNPRQVKENEDAVERFMAEARAAAALIHPHVVTIHNLGEAAGRHFIEMEYVAGRSLAQWVETMGRLDPIDATKFMVQIASALAAAHRAEMVHRDIKPANVLVTPAGAAKLADFGLAKRVVTAGGERDNQVLCGTPNHMAPELFCGFPADKRSDIYAMGVTYFYLLTGRLPFVGHSVAELAKRHQFEPTPDVRQSFPDVLDEAFAVVQRCLAKHPSDRYADAAELGADLRAVYGGLRSLRELLREALGGEQLQSEGVGEHFTLRVDLPGGRSQTVHIECCTSRAIAERVVRIFSVCGPANKDYYGRALELNSTIPHGAIAIEQINGLPRFVMANTYPRATCDAEEIRRSVLTIAEHADEIERALTAGDLH